MTGGQLFVDVVAWSAQAACLAALGGMLPAIVRLNAADVRYGYYRLLLVVCLALPWLQTRPLVAADVASQPAAILSAASGQLVSGTLHAATRGIDWSSAFAFVIVAGIVVRIFWVVLGLYRLRSLRAAARTAPAYDDSENELLNIVHARAEIRYLPDLDQPVTFGWRHPLVLLPGRLRDQPAHIRRAVVSHELFHVKRHDWPWLLAEELLRAVLWFHPAVWWLISRVQLAREEVVDRLAALVTGSRREYLDALMAFADDSTPLPVAAFARRRRLFHRLQSITKEEGMSTTRTLLAGAALAILLIAGAWKATAAFPLAAKAIPDQTMNDVPGPLERRANPVTPENPIPRRVYTVMPPAAPGLPAGVSMTLTFVTTIDESGRVGEVRVRGLAGFTPPSAARDAAGKVNVSGITAATANAIRQWRYDAPAEGPIAVIVAFAFTADGEPQLSRYGSDAQPRMVFRAEPPPPPPPPPPARGVPRPVTPAPGQPSTAPPPPPPPPPPGVQNGGLVLPVAVTGVKPSYTPAAMEQRIQGSVWVDALVLEDGTVGEAAVTRSLDKTYGLDEQALEAVRRWTFRPAQKDGKPVATHVTIEMTFSLRDRDWAEYVNRSQETLRILAQTSGSASPLKLKDVQPVYPQIAVAARKEGIVLVHAIIGADGKVTDASIGRSIPLLDQAALDAVRQWEFAPTVVDGQRVPVTLAVEVPFVLPRP